VAVLPEGTSLKHGTFVVERLLGRGGFGEVYLARQPRMERAVAIKVLTPAIAADESGLLRFKREALAAGSLSHPHVLPVHDFDYDDAADVWFLAMQYVPGGRTLSDRVGVPLLPHEAARLISAVASALDAAHALGIVHRDIKPANVLLDGDRPLLTDFGIAFLATTIGITATGTSIGTPVYMAPEQVLGHPVDARSDQYSLAVMAYQLLSGDLPFRGDPHSVMYQHVHAAPPPLREDRPALLAKLEAVLLRALSKQPRDRYESCGDFAAALTAAAPVQSASETIAASPGGTLSSTPSLTTRVSRPEAAMRTRAPRFGPPRLAALVGLAGIAALLVVVLLTSRTTPSPDFVVGVASPSSADATRAPAGAPPAPSPLVGGAAFVFATEVDGNGVARNAGTSFDFGSSDIYAVFPTSGRLPRLRVYHPTPGADDYYAYLEPAPGETGVSLGWRWFLNGQEITRFRYATEPMGPGDYVWLQMFNRSGPVLQPGTYAVTVEVNGEPIGTNRLEIQR
jgi:serine/threonine-protein kinase